MRKFAIAGLVAVAAFAFAGCANKAKTDGNMGATSGQCSKEGKCGESCKGEKANMGAVSGQKKSCCSSEKGAMGAVSGEKSCGSKSSCGDKGAMGAVSGEKSCGGK